MALTVSPERAQAQRLVSELAERLGSTLSEAGARTILELQAGGPSAERRHELAEKASEGSLSAQEHAEYETYAQLRGLLAILQSKARLYLKQTGAGDRAHRSWPDDGVPTANEF